MKWMWWSWALYFVLKISVLYLATVSTESIRVLCPSDVPSAFHSIGKRSHRRFDVLFSSSVCSIYVSIDWLVDRIKLLWKSGLPLNFTTMSPYDKVIRARIIVESSVSYKILSCHL
jgi:hypothetical protein